MCPGEWIYHAVDVTQAAELESITNSVQRRRQLRRLPALSRSPRNRRLAALDLNTSAIDAAAAGFAFRFVITKFVGDLCAPSDQPLAPPTSAFAHCWIAPRAAHR